MSQSTEPMTAAWAEGILDRVGAEVMETMFFSEAVVSECSHNECSPNECSQDGCDHDGCGHDRCGHDGYSHKWMSAAVGARVRFDGTHCGEVLTSVSEEAAQSIAAGFLGLDTAELAPAQLSQVILELANILCGAAMSHLWPESTLALEAPELADPCAAMESGWHRCFRLPEGMLAITIRMAVADARAEALPAPAGNAA